MKIALALIITLLALAFYLRTLAPGVLEGDPGEFQFVPYVLGIPHPPGYPLFCFLGWIWSHLFPVGNVAFKMNFFSALWGAAAVGLLALFALEVSREHNSPSYLWPPAVGALTFAFSRTFWSQATVAEVYTFNAFLLILFLWSVLKNLPLPVLSLILGSSLAHHRSFILILPGVIAFYLLRRSRPGGPFLLALVLLLAPLLLYLLIPLRAPNLPYLSVQLSPTDTLILYDNSFRGFLDFIMARRFGGLLRWEAISQDRLMEAGRWLVEEFGWGGIILGMVGILGLFLRRRWDILALTGLGFVSVWIFNLAYLIGDIRFLYTPVYLLFAFWISCGAGELAVKLGNKALLLIIVPFILLWQNFHTFSHSPGTDVARKWDYILSLPLPEGAILVSNDRDELVPLYYFQLVEKRRPDLIPLFPMMVPQLGDIGFVLDRALASGRPVFAIKPMEGLEVAYELQEWDGLRKVVGKVREEGFIPLNLEVSDSLTLAGYRLLERNGRIKIALYWKALGPLREDFHSYLHILGAGGERIAGSDHRPGGVFYPASLWKPGQLLRDVHEIEGAFAFPLRVKAGFYRWPSLEPFGKAVEFEVKP
ncbi:MAG: DUF2723 domain-containing protein [Anaerolineae bacterium]|nr:DUF2723 domain-containing protein [Anaerolineae bacterium]MDW8102575.1 DUF2723 domain-containing protein [Anaerolineae bacterium]